MLQVNVGITAL